MRINTVYWENFFELLWAKQNSYFTWLLILSLLSSCKVCSNCKPQQNLLEQKPCSNGEGIILVCVMLDLDLEVQRLTRWWWLWYSRWWWDKELNNRWTRRSCYTTLRPQTCPQILRTPFHWLTLKSSLADPFYITTTWYQDININTRAVLCCVLPPQAAETMAVYISIHYCCLTLNSLLLKR